MAELYNEGLIREGLLRTTNLVLPGLISKFDTIEEFLTRFAVNGVEAALALDFVGSEYRTANAATTFADAFMGNSPKLTYSTAAGSNSTMVNSEGKIVWAPHNLLDYSEDFSQWSALGIGGGIPPVLVSSNNVAPDGTNTATRFQFDLDEKTEGTNLSTIQRSVTPNSAGVDHTFRLWVKSTDGTSTYNMLIGNQGAAPITVDGTWRPVELEFAVTGQLTPGIYLRSGQTPVNSDTADILVWGAHYHRSDLGGMAQVPGADTGFEYYVPTNGNAEYLPRVGHHVYNGSTWVNEGLLIESEARTNLIQYSEDFSHSSWALTFIEPFGSGSTVNATTGPDGQTTADFIRPTTDSTNQHYVRANVTGSVGASYTISVYAKAGGYSSLSLRALGTNAPIVTYDLATGTADDPAGTIQAVGNGWFRCSLTGEATATYLWHYIYPNQNSTYAGDGTSGIYVWGAQIEQGQVVNGTPVDAPTPSSYMPTNGQPGGFTRTAQSLTVPPAEFGWNSDAVSIQMDGRMTYADEDDGEQLMFVHWYDTFSNYIKLKLQTGSTATGRAYFQQLVNGANYPALIDTYTPGVNVPFSIASRHGSTFVRGATDGVLTNLNELPTALPDLSSTDLEIAQDFMGTIGTFRQFAGDIGDDGLEEATS